MVGVIVALEEEAKAFSEEFKLTKTISEEGRVFYRGADMIVAVSGVGKVNAQIATSILVSLGLPIIINVGTCVSMVDRFKIGQLVEPNVFFDGDFDLSSEDISTKDPAMVNRQKLQVGIPCYTYSTYNVDTRARSGIVDMEAYAIVAQAMAMNVPTYILKVVEETFVEASSEHNKDLIKAAFPRVKEIMEGS